MRPQPKTEPFTTVSVPIPKNSKSKCSISDCFRMFCADERLSAENALQCQSCGRRTPGTKKLLFRSLPRCLLVHLIRFPETGVKCNDPITFPLAGFDMSPFMSSKATKSTLLYDCVAVCCHHGSSVSNGHYTSYSKRSGNWYLFDDAKLPKPVDETLISSEAETKKAYLIFYVRRS